MSSEAPSTPAARLAALRDAMREHGIDAWWLPSSDPHNSEYLPEHWAGRAWLSGFDGSVGTLVVTEHAAGVWVDSRYWVQAEEQLAGSGIELMKLHPGQGDAPMQWLADNLESGATLGFDADVVALASARRWKRRCRRPVFGCAATWTCSMPSGRIARRCPRHRSMPTTAPT